MDLRKYQASAYTAIQRHSSAKEEEMHWALGLGEESGEVLGVVKHRHYGEEFSVIKLAEELGDVLWHIAALCTTFNIRLEDVAQYNLYKLQYRYPDGTFDAERSNNRHELEKEFHKMPDVRELVSKIEVDHAMGCGMGCRRK